MKKTEVNGGEEMKEAKPKFIGSEELRSRPNLGKLVDAHGTIYLTMPDGVPLKITRAKLS